MRSGSHVRLCCVAGKWWRGSCLHPSELIAPQARLDEEQIYAHASKDDEEHHGCDRRAHVRIADLELEAEEGAIKERAQDVRGVIGAGQRSLRRVDQVERVEVAH